MSNKANSRASSILSSSHGLLFAALSAAAAEFILMNFLRGTPTLSSIARFSICFITIYTIYRFATASLTRFKRENRDVILLCAVTLCSIFVIWLFRVIFIGLATNARTSAFAASLTPESFYFAVPYAAGGLLLQALLGLHYGMVFAITLAVIVGIYTPGQPIFVPYVLACNLVACLSLSRFRSRSSYIKAGLNVSIIALPFALASILLRSDVVDVAQVMAAIVGALLSGVICTFIAAGLTPVVEYLGGYVTDMRLIEMATLDHPLLKELSIQAPGTWNHSMVMGMMVESAADAIGANTVLARVGAYFHDVGKLRKPLYFVENQFGEENRHDKLSTSMSALIIRSHVKDGIDLARKHGLPEPIVDMIPQHHGTSLIEYFYEKACRELKEEESEASEVDRSLYTYPGPKPQTREAGILMLADSIEAAARTLTEPTADRIQGMVQKLINKIFASGELNECELTLQDLHKIAKTFTRVLTGIYHQRIAYAEPAEKTSDRAPLKLVTPAQPEDAAESPDAARPKAEDLKRLGM